MSRSHHHFLALLPLFAILSSSPMELESRSPSRGPSSEEEKVLAHPKYDARSAKVDRTKSVIDKDLDLQCLTEKRALVLSKLQKVQKDYKIEISDEEEVRLQKAEVQSIILSMVDLEENFKALKEKKGIEKLEEQLAEKDLEVLTLALEKLLEDEAANELHVAEAEKKAKEKEEARAILSTKSPEGKLLCELEDQNKALSKEVKELTKQQATITESLLAANTMLAQIAQKQQQQSFQYPWWMTSTSMIPPQQAYPTLQAPGGTWVYQPQQVQAQVQVPQQMVYTYQQPAQIQYVQPQMGQQTLLQTTNSGQFQYVGQPQPSQYDLQFSQPQPIIPGSFGSSPFNFNFGSNRNQQA